MITSFSELNLHPQLVQAVADRGYVTPSPIQAGIIPVMLTGRDVIGQAQTGTGKTAAFSLPILHNIEPGLGHVQSLVLVPTRELAMQVANAMFEYGRHRSIQVLPVYGGQSYTRQTGRLKKGVDVVVGTPGRLLDLIKQKALDLRHTKTVVLDEADEMLSMGFIEDIESILKETPSERQTALFSATLPTAIRRLADRYMTNPQSVTIQKEQVTVALIEQRYYLMNQVDKLSALTRLFEIEPITSALIFARTRLGTGELANELARRGFPAEALSGDLSQEARERVLNRFRQNQIKVLVATDVAARGLDIDDISHVFNYDLPDDPEVYVHRIGRTGRAGKTGIAISLLTPGEYGRLARIETFAKQKIARAKLPTVEDIQNYREAEWMSKMLAALERGRSQNERQIVTKMVELGHDPLELAAVALKLARSEEIQRPIAPISEVREMSQRRTSAPDGRRGERGGERSSERPGERRGGSQPAWGASSAREKGMVRLTFSKGKAHGVRPNDMVNAIAFHADIPGNIIGKIQIDTQHTLVDVPEKFVSKVLAKTGSYRIRKHLITVERA